MVVGRGCPWTTCCFPHLKTEKGLKSQPCKLLSDWIEETWGSVHGNSGSRTHTCRLALPYKVEESPGLESDCGLKS